MNFMIRTTMLTAAAFAILVVPALAESTSCVVTAPEICLRKSPSKSAKVVTVLKKSAKVNAANRCGGGWVKVTSADGRFSGYVGGWALGGSPAVVAAPATGTDVEVAKVEPAVAPVVPKEIPSNEQLAIQITKLRLDVLRLDRDMDGLKKDVQKVKALAHRGSSKHVAANSSKSRKQLVKLSLAK